MRILILTAATGGGHDMRANALSRWVEHLADWDAQICRPLEDSHRLYRFGVNLYNGIQRFAPRTHHGYFAFLEIAALHRNPGRILGAKRYLSKIASFRPDLIVSTHAHLNHAYFDLARRVLGPSNVRCVTYCGELGGGYGFSRHWVNPDADLFIGAVDDTVRAAVALGMPRDKAWVGGFMLYPEFYDEKDDRQRCREFVIGELGMDPDAFLVLLAIGAVGANNHLEILGSLERRGKPVQVVALCGSDEKTFESVSTWGRRASHVTVRALGYRDDMSRILRAASVVVSRAGTGTTSEAIMSNCPIIMNGIGGVMPQESITVRYGMRHGIARLIRRAGEVGGMLDAWERNPATLHEMKRRIREQRPDRHPRDMVARVSNLRVPRIGDLVPHTELREGVP